MGERLLCKQEVVGSIPSGSTRWAVEVLPSFRMIGVFGAVGATSRVRFCNSRFRLGVC